MSEQDIISEKVLDKESGSVSSKQEMKNMKKITRTVKRLSKPFSLINRKPKTSPAKKVLAAQVAYAHRRLDEILPFRGVGI